MKFQPDGEEIIKAYYETAPEVVERLKGLPDKDRIYRELWEDGIRLCVEHIEAGEYEKCKDKYISTVEQLRDRVFADS